VRAGHWVWEAEGMYFGIPLQNYWGWWLTTFTVFVVFLFLRPRVLDAYKPAAGAGNRLAGYDALAVICYAVTGLSNAVGATLMGLTGPALVGLALMGAGVAAWLLRRK